MTVCVVWQRFGPYHRARLVAATRLFHEKGARVIGIEVASRGGGHRWRAGDADGTEIVRLFPDEPLESLSRRRIFTAMRHLLDRVGPDAIAVPAYSKPAAQAALSWARDRRRIAVVMSDSRREDAVRSQMRERVKRAIVSQFDAALAGGAPQVRYIHDLGIRDERIFTPYDVVDNEYFATRAAMARADPAAYGHLPGAESGHPFFLACGRFIERKNFASLLKAYGEYRELRCGMPPWDLVLVGDGPQRARLEALAAGIAPFDAVSFAGYRQVEDVAAYYGLASAFIHPAVVEQWGLVVNEAMAAGLPVLASTGVGATEDLVRDGVNGFTFDPNNCVAIAAAMERVSAADADPDAMARYSRERIAQWSPSRFADGLWHAVVAGASSADRGMPRGVRLLLWTNRHVPRRVLALRSVEE